MLRLALTCAIAGAGVLTLLAPLQPASAADTPQRGGTLTYAIQSTPSNFDCDASGDSRAVQIVAPFYSGLLRFNPANTPRVIGDLAESWTVSPDGKTYTFTLYPDIHFHDGSNLTSADVKATYDRRRAPPPGVVSFRKANFAAVDQIDAPDPRTVVFHLSHPYPALLLMIASPYGCVYSAQKLATDTNYPKTDVMGSGPFVFGEYVPGASVTGKRFDGYFRKGMPYLDGIRQLYIRGPGMINALAGAQVDATLSSVVPADRETIRAARGAAMAFPDAPYGAVTFATINNRKPPFDDVRVRRALTLAIDRRSGDVLLQRSTNFKGYGGLFNADADMEMSAEEMNKLPGFGPDMAANRAEAKRLLAESGQSNLHFTFLNRNDGEPFRSHAIFMLDQWRQIGLTVDQAVVDSGTFIARESSGDFQVAEDTFGFEVNDPTEVLVKYLPDNTLNYTGVKDPMLQDLFDRQALATDPAERRRLVTQFQTRVIDQAYVIPGFRTVGIAAVPANMRGWQIMATASMNMSLAEVWFQK